MRVYEKIREYLDVNGLKSAIVANLAGIPESTFTAMLNGDVTLYADDLRAICFALNVQPELFIEYKIA